MAFFKKNQMIIDKCLKFGYCNLIYVIQRKNQILYARELSFSTKTLGLHRANGRGRIARLIPVS